MRDSHLSESEILRLVGEIRDKLNSDIFNGGFEVLAQNVANIERSQRELLDKLDALHRVVYEPDDGLFARLKRTENLHKEEFRDLAVKVQTIGDWKAVVTAPGGTQDKVVEHGNSIALLMQWKNRIIGICVSAVGATILMFGKLLWDFITQHVSVH